jgi:hypothetical protein
VTPEAELSDRSGLFVDISGPTVVAAWTAAMEAHATQLRTRDYVELQLSRTRLLGLRAGVLRAMVLFPNDPLVFDSLDDLDRTARQF